MKDKIKQFWTNFLLKLDDKINQHLNKGKPGKTSLTADDDSVVNFFVMVLKKVLNHVFLQCDFALVSDSSQTEPLKELCEDLQVNCYKIGAYMLGGSDTPQQISECWAVPYFDTVNGEKKLFHNYLNGDRIRITATIGGRITDCFMIIGAATYRNSTYFLCRRHELDKNGNLKISFFVMDESAKTTNANIAEWQSLIETETVYYKANNIGFGRYKSPVLAIGNDTYGKPLNYGCAEIESKIQVCLQQISDEFKHKNVRIFADENIVRNKDKNGKDLGMNVIDECIYTMRQVAGGGKPFIEVFSPEFRESAYYTHLVKLLEQYQSLMGVNELITHERSGNSATATEIRTLNLDNISLEDNIRRAVKEGNIQTLEADSMYLGIRPDLWTYDETWTDIYADEQQKMDNLKTAIESGWAEQIDGVKYWNDSLSEEEAEEKLNRINAEKQSKTNKSIEDMLNE